MFPQRLSRINSLMQSELSNLLERYQENWSSLSRGFLLTVTRVEVEKNLEKAKVYYSWTSPERGISKEEGEEAPHPGDSVSMEIQELLERRSFEISRELMRRVKLRKFPKLTFTYDANLEAGDRVYRILEEINKGKKGRAA